MQKLCLKVLSGQAFDYIRFVISKFFSTVGFFSCQVWFNGICFYKWYFSNNQNIEIFSCFHSSSRWLQVFFIMKFALYWKLACWDLLWNTDIGNRHFLLWNVKVNSNYFMKKWLVYKTYFLKKKHSFTEFPLSFGRSFFSVYFKKLTTVGRRMYNHPKNLMIQSWFEF